MTTAELINTPVVDFDAYKDRFRWDFFFHVPVLTPKFVEEELGNDLVDLTGSEAQAQKMLNTIAKISKDFLFGKMPERSINYQLYRMARSLDLINNYLEYEMSFVIAATTTGSVYQLYNLTNKEGTTIKIIENAAAQAGVKFRASAFQTIPANLLWEGY